MRRRLFRRQLFGGLSFGDGALVMREQERRVCSAVAKAGAVQRVSYTPADWTLR